MSFRDSLEHPTEARPWTGSIPLTHRYTAGVAGERFLRALKDRGKLLASRCEHCSYTYLPPRMYCERCLSPLPESSWIEVGLQGELVSFSQVHLDLDGNPLQPARWVGLVRLDGASGVLLHYLQDPQAGGFHAGLRVEAVLKLAKDRRGSILDISHFKVVG